MRKLVLAVICVVLLLSHVSFSEMEKKIEDDIYEAADDEITVIVQTDDDSTLKSAAEVRRFQHANLYAARMNKKQIKDMEYLPQIEKVWLSREKKILLDVSVPIISAPAAWNLGYNGSGVRVCVLDTGVDKTHPSLADRVINESDFTGGSNPDDVNGHGTHVAGIAAGNDTTYRGVAFGASILNAKVCNDAGGCSDADILLGVDWCVSNGAHILTLSLGGPASPADGSDALSSYLDTIVDKGKTVTVAAGNSGPGGNTNCRTSDATGNSFSICAPGVAHKVITVGSTDTGKGGTVADALSSFSSRGPTNDSRIKPDVLAPGQWISSSNNNWESQDDFVQKRGTSMSTPHVAGLAALILQAKNLTPEEVKALMMNAAVDLTGNFSKANDNAAGRINVSRIFDEVNNTRREVISGAPKVHNIFVPPNASEIRTTLYWPERYSLHQNLDLKILDPGGDTISSSSSVFNTDERVIAVNPISGYWKVLVVPKSVSGSTNYSIAGNFQPSKQLFLTNDSITAISYHKINATGNMEINLDWNNESRNLDLYIYNASGNLYAVSAGSSNRENVSTGAGQWTIKIVPAAPVKYALTSNFPVSGKVVDTLPPAVNITAPLNNSGMKNPSVTVNFTSADNLGLEQSCLYNLNSSVFLGNVTSGKKVSFSLNLTDGRYSINVTCTDQSGNTGVARVSFAIDNAKPVINFSLPTDANNAYVSRNHTFINATVSDALTDISACVLEWDGTNQTMTKAGTRCFINKTSADGAYIYRLYSNDSANNIAVETRNITFDTKAPVILNFTPANNSTIFGLENETFILRYNETYLQRVSLYWKNLSAASFTNVSMSCAQECKVMINLSSYPPHAIISFYFEAVDLAGNEADTPLLTAKILDRVPPSAVFAPPTPLNAIINDADHVAINITADEPLLSAVLEFNGTNESMSGSGQTWLLTKLNLSDGNYTFKAYVTDEARNANVTQSLWVFINTTRDITEYFNMLNSSLAGRNITVIFLETEQETSIASLRSFRNYTIRFNASGILADIINFSLLNLNTSNIINVSTNISGIGNVTDAFSMIGSALNALIWVDINSALAGHYTGKITFPRKYYSLFYLNGTQEFPQTMNISSECNSNVTPCFDNSGNKTIIYLASFSGAAGGNEAQKPEISILSPKGTVTEAHTSVNYIVSDNSGIGTCKYSLNSGSNVSLPGCINTTIIAASGTNTLVIYVDDTSGNENQSITTFTFTPPQPSGGSGGGGGGGGGSSITGAVIAKKNQTNATATKQETSKTVTTEMNETVNETSQIIELPKELPAVEEAGKNQTITQTPTGLLTASQTRLFGSILVVAGLTLAYYFYHRMLRRPKRITRKMRKAKKKRRHS